jgi:MHS family alpha-ketoglutarate permease-like MFS transporter
LIALYLRRNLEESHSFTRSAAQRREAGQLRALLRHPREALTVVGLTMGGTLYFYVFTNYMQKFLVNTVGLTKGDSTLISAASLCVFMLLQPAMGALSDRIGRRNMLIAFGTLAIFTTLPLMSALERATDVWTAFALVMCALCISSLYSSVSAVVKAELFPVEIRALGVGLPYAVAVSLFGGSADYVALSLKHAGHESWFYWYVTACVGVSLAVYVSMSDTRKTSRLR